MKWDILYNYLFILAIALFWIGLISYLIWRRYWIQKKSEGLEVEAEMGRSSGQLFHDISGQLQTLAGYVYYLQESMRDSGGSEKEIQQLQELLKTIISYTADAKQTVKDVYKSKTEKIDLVDVLHRIVTTQAKMCFKKMNIRINEKYPEEKILVSSRAFEAMFNVVRNACEAMANSEVRKLDVSVEKVNGFAVVRISDNGAGIPDKIRGKIFEYGFTTKESGTGQGMTITKQAVDKSGGTLDFESEIGKGTTMTMKFPILPEQKQENPNQAKQQA